MAKIERITYLFKRYEKKYFLTQEQYNSLMQEISERLENDSFGKSTITNIYLDTPSFLLIRNSIDAKKYKEKLRIRSYGTPKEDSRVFFEIKKKYKGVVYKRRLALTYKQVCDYIYEGIVPCDSQIMREIDWCMKIYGNPLPAAVLSYEREAFFWKEDKNIRLTFDRNVRYRMNDLNLLHGDGGTEIIPSDSVLLEIKTPGAVPLWLSDALNKCSIFPTSFSKYGKSYINYMKMIKNNTNNNKGSRVYE